MDNGIENDGAVGKGESAVASAHDAVSSGPCSGERPDLCPDEGRPADERIENVDIRSESDDVDIEGMMVGAIAVEAAAAAEAARLREAASKREAAFREVREYVQAILLAIVLAMVIMTFIGRSFVVEGASMEPTLHNRERIIVEKVSYRFREPARGEIIVLKNPWRPDQSGMAAAMEAMRELVDFSGSMRPYIKRIVAVAGDRVQIKNGVLYLNGKPIDEPYILERPWSDYGPVIVPEDHVFVLGDNRNNSDDSRGSVGFLRVNRIVGRACVRYYPFDRMGVLKAPPVYE